MDSMATKRARPETVHGILCDEGYSDAAASEALAASSVGKDSVTAAEGNVKPNDDAPVQNSHPIASVANNALRGSNVSMSASDVDSDTIITEDPFNLRRRFVRMHKECFNRALAEMKSGRKRSCWCWFIFPTAPWVVGGVERGSFTNRRYALRDMPPNELLGDDAARAFLRYPVVDGVSLRENYLQIVQEVTQQVRDCGVSVVDLVGFLDDPKLRSSVRLFERVSRDGFDDEVHATCATCLEAMGESPEKEMYISQPSSARQLEKV